MTIGNKNIIAYLEIIKIKNLAIPILAVLISMQCFSQRSEKIIIDDTAKTIFTPTELKGIEEMIKFVDGAVSDSNEASDINQIYHTYFDKLGSFVKKGKIFPSLLKDSTKFKYLETIDKNAFEAIWRMNDYVKKVRFRDTTLTDLHGFKTLELNYQGKYLNYLKELGKSDRHYAEIHNQIEFFGDLPPSIVGWFILNHQEFDFTSFNDRLWATVFLLRLGDPLEEKVERYLKGKKY